VGEKRFFTLVAVIFLVFSLTSINYLCAGGGENIKQWSSQLSDRKERAAAKNKLILAKEKATDELMSALKGEHVKFFCES